MARPLRIEFPGAVYHVMARGNARQPIFLVNSDRTAFLERLKLSCDRFNWRCHAYCLMENHYHLLLETLDGNLARGMRELNGVYAQFFNRRHDRIGHLFQGRYKAPLVSKSSYLLELCRYIVLNPVRAGLVKYVDEWRWSSYAGTAGLEKAHPVLTRDWLLAQFSSSSEIAIMNYRQFVHKGLGSEIAERTAKEPFLLGVTVGGGAISDQLRMARTIDDIPVKQRFADRPVLEELFGGIENVAQHIRNQKIREAVLGYRYSQSEIARFLGLHSSTISLIVNSGSGLESLIDSKGKT